MRKVTPYSLNSIKHCLHLLPETSMWGATTFCNRSWILHTKTYPRFLRVRILICFFTLTYASNLTKKQSDCIYAQGTSQYQADPCCNATLALSQCCYPRAVVELVPVATPLNAVIDATCYNNSLFELILADYASQLLNKPSPQSGNQLDQLFKILNEVQQLCEIAIYDQACNTNCEPLFLLFIFLLFSYFVCLFIYFSYLFFFLVFFSNAWSIQRIVIRITVTLSLVNAWSLGEKKETIYSNATPTIFPP